ncbi:lymphocyte antigen 6E isoform X2 [Ornithorhynchus anatinus]|uniref:lymphocyte antigen 6E isoform X2 n=1 Tax=Ornithorhynchus anatinus TaxID=9258 RepID=UPI0004547C79|nr:lymphocyte antigen 6E isoform X2 [Ornithorhynchus anatinus]
MGETEQRNLNGDGFAPSPAGASAVSRAAEPTRLSLRETGRETDDRKANPSGILVMKSCAPTCPNSTVSSDGRALSVSCCQGNMCNRSAATGVRGSQAMVWAAAISASLLCALFRARL